MFFLNSLKSVLNWYYRLLRFELRFHDHLHFVIIVTHLFVISTALGVWLNS